MRSVLARSVIATAGIVALAAVLFAATESTKSFSPAQKRWWAFQPVARPPVPSIENRAWVRNPIDAFVLAKLEAQGLKPNPPASRVTLLRRASLDLTGLPPSLEDVQSFLADNQPDAWARAVDRLLASPRYGERWARHWLDLARYSDSEGFKSDETRPNIWRYRDYVIRSFNDDKPYDRFVREQIAGDELYPGNTDALIATGFNRHFPDESNARNLTERRKEILNDITDVVGYTFMGLTVACARCHDHKFDPILQKDYFRLQAFFANTRIEDHAVLGGAGLQPALSKWETETREIRAQIHALVKPKLDEMAKENYDKFPEDVQTAINTAPEKRTPEQWHLWYKARPYLEFPDEAAAGRYKNDKRYQELRAELAKYDNIKPDVPVGQVMIDHEGPAPKTEVAPGFLAILNVPPPATDHPRSQLANWLTDSANPLSTRVIVNRVWHHHFGRGIVGTPSDFGMMGDRPTNKELLDYLTTAFIENGWSLKKLHRTILTSNTYQQSSDFNTESAKIDPDNKYLWRFNRYRLEGEAIRDSMLYVSGRLNTKMYGPGVFPPLPAGLETRGGWKKNEDPSEAARRSVYIFVRRNTRYPMMEAFDMPDTHESCARRNNTVTPTQSLELLNNDQILDWAKSFAQRSDGSIDRAFKLAYLRDPNSEELKQSQDYLHKAGLQDLCHTLLISNEFLYVN